MQRYDRSEDHPERIELGGQQQHETGDRDPSGSRAGQAARPSGMAAAKSSPALAITTVCRADLTRKLSIVRPALNVASHRIHYAAELSRHSVPDVLNDTAMVFGGLRIDESANDLATESATLLLYASQSAVAGDAAGK
jgi:2-keto-4-pentenoate hydratase